MSSIVNATPLSNSLFGNKEDLKESCFGISEAEDTRCIAMCINLFDILQGQCRTSVQIYFSLDISNFVSSGETLTYISLLLGSACTKNRDINNITILIEYDYQLKHQYSLLDQL